MRDALTGLLLAPFGWLLHRIVQQRLDAPGTAELLGAALLLLAASWVRPARPRRIEALVLLALGAGLGLAQLSDPSGPASDALWPLVPLVLGLSLAMGRSPALGPLLLGGAAGALVLLPLLPAVGLLPLLAVAVLALPWLPRGAGAGASEAEGEEPDLVAETDEHGSKLVPRRVEAATALAWLLLAGVAAGITETLYGPFRRQFVPGATVAPLVEAALLCAGVGLLFVLFMPARLRRPSWRTFAVGQSIALFFLGGAHAAVVGALGPPAASLEPLAPVTSRPGLLVAVVPLLGVSAVALGFFGSAVNPSTMRRGDRRRGGAALVTGLALGLALARPVLDDEGWPPLQRAFESRLPLRVEPTSVLQNWGFHAGVVSEVTARSTMPPSRAVLWQGRRADHSGPLEGLARLQLDVGLALGSRSLVVVTTPDPATVERVRKVGGQSVCIEQAFAPAPGGELALAHDHDGSIVVLAAPFLSSDAARVTSPAWLHRLLAARRAWPEPAVLAIWLDLRAVSWQGLSATAALLEQGARAPAERCDAFLALDGQAGPFLLVTVGPAAREPIAARFPDRLRELPVQALVAGARPASPWRPVLELTAPLREPPPLADPPLLARLAAAARAGGDGTLAHLLDALAAHSAGYEPLVLETVPHERHVFGEAEQLSLLGAIAEGGGDPLVVHQVRRACELANARQEYAWLLAVGEALLDVHVDAGVAGLVGRAHFELLDDTAAVSALERAAATGEADTAALVLLGRVWIRLGDDAAARSALQEAAARSPSDPLLVRDLALALVDAEAPELARPLLEGLAALHPGDEELEALLLRLP